MTHELNFEDELDFVDEHEGHAWDVWPYCWAAAGWKLTRDRFHSFHGNLNEKIAGRFARSAGTCSGVSSHTELTQSLV